MIRRKHVNEEVENAKAVVESSTATVGEKIKVLYKLVTVAIKVILSTRVNTLKIMDKLGIEPDKPQTRPSAKDTTTTEKKS